jgi:hypothetical protein
MTMPTKPNKAESPSKIASTSTKPRHTNSKTQNSRNNASPPPTPNHTLPIAPLALWQAQAPHDEPWNSFHVHVQAQSLVHSSDSPNHATSVPLGDPAVPTPRDASLSPHTHTAASIRGRTTSQSYAGQSQSQSQSSHTQPGSEAGAGAGECPSSNIRSPLAIPDPLADTGTQDTHMTRDETLFVGIGAWARMR